MGSNPFAPGGAYDQAEKIRLAELAAEKAAKVLQSVRDAVEYESQGFDELEASSIARQYELPVELVRAEIARVESAQAESHAAFLAKVSERETSFRAELSKNSAFQAAAPDIQSYVVGNFARDNRASDAIAFCRRNPTDEIFEKNRNADTCDFGGSGYGRHGID